MVRIIINHKSVVLKRFLLMLRSILVEYFSKSKMNWNTSWVKLKAMLEVLLSLSHLI